MPTYNLKTQSVYISHTSLENTTCIMQKTRILQYKPNYPATTTMSIRLSDVVLLAMRLFSNSKSCFLFKRL